MTASASDEQQSEEAPQSRWASVFWCALYGSGIIICLVIYGVLQERIMSEPYTNGTLTEMFTTSAFLVFINRIVAVLYAGSMITVKRDEFKNQAPLWKYGAVSISNVAASWCQYEALKHVTFPVQMLGKSFKMMPVMAWGMCISSKRYSLTDWTVAIVVTGGVTEFLLTGNISSKHSHGTSWVGLVLLALFLAFDGFTSTFQEKLFKEHKTSKYNQMLYVNSWSTLVSLITMIAMGDLVPAFAFCGHHGSLIGDAIALSIAAVAGQWFIYSQVKEFGALVFAATMNVRQVVSIIVSYIRYHHVITGLQVLGLVLVFVALFYKSAMGFMATKDEKHGAKEDVEQKSLKANEGRQNLEDGYGTTGAKPQSAQQ